MEKTFDENIMRRYLLGALSESEQTEVEDAVFSDADIRAILETAENDLIDEYARGELDDAERVRFEKMFLNSDERRRKIEFATAFNSLPATESKVLSEISADEKKGFLASILSFFQTPQIAFAVVLLIFLAFGAIFFLTRDSQDPQIAQQGNVNQNSDIKITPTPIEQTPTPVAENTNVAPNISKPNVNKNTENKIGNMPSPTPQPKTPETSPTFAALVFPAGLVRDGGANRKFSLTLPKNVSQARFVFNIEKGDERPSYRIGIQTKSGSVITQTKVTRRNMQLNLSIPSAKLSAGNYTATVRGISADGASETLGYYDFEIVKP